MQLSQLARLVLVVAMALAAIGAIASQRAPDPVGEAPVALADLRYAAHAIPTPIGVKATWCVSQAACSTLRP